LNLEKAENVETPENLENAEIHGVHFSPPFAGA
jgi:hypothetical protein